MVAADSAVETDAPPLTVIRTGWPQAAEPVTTTATKPPVRSLAAMGPCEHDRPPESAVQLHPPRPGIRQPVIGVEPDGSEMLAVSVPELPGPLSPIPKLTVARWPNIPGPSTLTCAVS
jgi:hypothetical protein